jgi:hypothetical protein
MQMLARTWTHPRGLLLNARAVIVDSIAALGHLLKFGEPRKL